MNHVTRFAVALVATFGLAVLSPATVHAESAACSNPARVTPAEYDQLQVGMTYAEVRALAGSRGREMDPYSLSLAVGHMERTWMVACSQTGGVHLSFERVGRQWLLEWSQVRWS